MTSEALILKEKYELFCNVFGKDDDRTLSLGFDYFESVLPETDDIVALFDSIVERIKTGERIKGNSAGKGKALLDKLVVVIFEKLTDDPRVFHWYSIASQFGLENAEGGIGYCYLNEIGIEEDEDKALGILEPLAKKGNLIAEYTLGCWFMYDEKKASKFLEDAANKGFAKAQEALAFDLFSDGMESEDDDKLREAVKWFVLAAEHGLPEAEYALGMCYRNGFGVASDCIEAAGWLTKAANQGHREACREMGNICYNGDGKEQDYEEAIKWYRAAFDNRGDSPFSYKDAEDLYNLGECFYLGLGIEQDYEQAFHWFEKAKQFDYLKAETVLGDCFLYGHGTEINYEKAARLYMQAAENGDELAQLKLGKCYNKGIGVNKDSREAIKWFEKAAELGSKEALNILGNLYYKGKDVDQDYEKAARLYQRAADQGYDWAQYNLGNCYYHGKGVQKDIQKGMELFRKAEVQGNETAKDRIGKILLEESENQFSRERKESFKESLRLYRELAKSGNSNAQFTLGRIYSAEGSEFSDRINEWLEKDDFEITQDEIDEYKELYPDKNDKRLLRGAESLKWLKKASAQKHIEALESVASIYYGCGSDYSSDEVVQKAKRKAFEYFKTLAELGVDHYYYEVGKYYQVGLAGVKKDIDEAVKWFELGFKKGNPTATLELCDLLTQGANKHITIINHWYSNFSYSSRLKYFDEEKGIQMLIDLVEKYNDKSNWKAALDGYYAEDASKLLETIKKSKGVVWCLKNGANKWPKPKKWR